MVVLLHHKWKLASKGNNLTFLIASVVFFQFFFTISICIVRQKEELFRLRMNPIKKKGFQLALVFGLVPQVAL